MSPLIRPKNSRPTSAAFRPLGAAIDLAGDNQGRVTMVNTGRDGTCADASLATAEDIDAQLGEAGVEHEVRQPSTGRPASDEILAVADEVGADLIVIGIRRRSPVGKLVTGSTAQNILLDATCAVLAVKAS